MNRQEIICSIDHEQLDGDIESNSDNVPTVPVIAVMIQQRIF